MAKKIRNLYVDIPNFINVFDFQCGFTVVIKIDNAHEKWIGELRGPNKQVFAHIEKENIAGEWKFLGPKRDCCANRDLYIIVVREK